MPTATRTNPLSYLGDQILQRAAETDSEANDRYELVRWLSFVATEIHKRVLWPIYSPTTSAAVKDDARASAARALDFVAAHLESRDVLVGRAFSVADAYLFWALTILPHAGVPLEGRAALQRYHALHRERPAVRAAFKYEKAAFETPFAA